jgi:hypothetical protein
VMVASFVFRGTRYHQRGAVRFSHPKVREAKPFVRYDPRPARL